MKSPLFLVPLALVSCATVSPTSSTGNETYRYVNTLDFGNNNTLDAISVIGYDESQQKEATRLDVTIGNEHITLRDPYDGSAGGALYNPSVELKKDGALVVGWSRIGEVSCKSEIIADSSGKLVERKRTEKEL